MQRPCDVCGRPYEAKRRTSRFCSGRCRQRNHENPRPVPLVAMPPAEPGEITKALTSELTNTGQMSTWLGQHALILARRLDDPFESGAGVAALSKAFRAVLAELDADRVPVDDPLDQLRRRRDRKRYAR